VSANPSVALAIRALLDVLADAVAERVAARTTHGMDASQKSARSAPVADFLGEAEVARRTGLSRRTLQSWRLRGSGPPFAKTGRRVLYPVRELDEFLRTRSQA
jgi:hypothetical protein